MSEWIEVPDPVVSEVGQLLTYYGKTATPAVSTTSLPPVLVQSLIDYLGVDLVCDHSVNICACREAAVVAALKLALIGKRYCPTCCGDGVIYESGDDGDMECPTCEKCGGSGIVAVPA